MSTEDAASSAENEPSAATAPAADGSESNNGRKPRIPRTFPASSFMEALPLAVAIQKHASGRKVRRITLFDDLGRSVDSSTSRQLMTNSVQYGLTKGGYSAEYLELTESGRLASAEDVPARQQVAARLTLAIERIAPFNLLYEQFKNDRLPTQSVLRDAVIQSGTPADRADECVQTFLVNARDLGLVRTVAGAERMLTFEYVLEQAAEADATGNEPEAPADLPPTVAAHTVTSVTSTLDRVLVDASDLSDVCFVISPIGQEGSEHRNHADLVLGSILEPALVNMGLRIVRADRIAKPGMITSQIVEHLVRAPLVVADLSYGNPNVFYELALRHASRRPAVQIVRKADPLPFDVGQFRTVVIDTTDIYTLVPHLDSYRAEVTRQCRAAMNGEGPVDSPLSMFYPSFWEEIGQA